MTSAIIVTDINEAFKILELEPGSSGSTIKRQYHRLARKRHPDTAHGSHEAFEELQAAFELIQRQLASEKASAYCQREQQMRDCINEELRKAALEKDRAHFLELCEKIKREGMKMDLTTLMRVLDGARLVHDLSRMHCDYCLTIIEEWEKATGMVASIDAFHRVMLDYAEGCNDGDLVMTSVTRVVEKMQDRDIERTYYTDILINKAIVRQGRIGLKGRGMEEAAKRSSEPETMEEYMATENYDYGAAYGM